MYPLQQKAKALSLGGLVWFFSASKEWSDGTQL